MIYFTFTDYLMDLIANDVAKKKQILIFCNKASTSAYVSHFLNDQGIESLHFAGGNMHPSKRQYNLKRDELSLFRGFFVKFHTLS